MQKRFVCDLMLGKLCRWLRIMGYDTIVEGDDRKLKRLSTKRIVLTRDKQLETRNTILIKSLDLDGQLKEVVEKARLKPQLAKIRCPICNGKLKEVGKKDVEKDVPKKVLESQESFWLCSSCKKIYWEGTHWKGIRRRVRSLSKKR